MPLTSRVYHVSVPLGEFQRVSSSYLLQYMVWVHPCPLLFLVLRFCAKNRWWWKWWFLTGWMTTDHLLETETTGISCQNRFKSQRVAFDLPLPGDCQSGEAWMLVQSCSISVTMGEGFRWLLSTSSNQDLWVRRIYWLKRGSHLTHWFT